LINLKNGKGMYWSYYMLNRDWCATLWPICLVCAITSSMMLLEPNEALLCFVFWTSDFRDDFVWVRVCGIVFKFHTAHVLSYRRWATGVCYALYGVTIWKTVNSH